MQPIPPKRLNTKISFKFYKETVSKVLIIVVSKIGLTVSLQLNKRTEKGVWRSLIQVQRITTQETISF